MCDNNCDPCQSSLNEQESIASQMTNLISNLLGTLTKTITNGRAVWSQPCDVYASLTAFPRNSGEGLICYLLRIFSDYFTPMKGQHNSANSYYENDVVADSATYSFYRAVQDVPAGILVTNTTYWQVLVVAPSGSVGPQGPSGAGSAINYAVTTRTGNYTATATDAVIFCDPAANMTITLPLANATSGKWFKIINRTGAFTVTIQRAGSDTINGATTFPLAFSGDSAELINDNSTKWSVW